MRPVKSGSIAAVGHDPETGVLSVKFHSGQTYHYAGVPADAAAKLQNAESVGRHFMEHIRGNFKTAK
jgi:hypothetical protein